GYCIVKCSKILKIILISIVPRNIVYNFWHRHRWHSIYKILYSIGLINYSVVYKYITMFIFMSCEPIVFTIIINFKFLPLKIKGLGIYLISFITIGHINEKNLITHNYTFV